MAGLESMYNSGSDHGDHLRERRNVGSPLGRRIPVKNFDEDADPYEEFQLNKPNVSGQLIRKPGVARFGSDNNNEESENYVRLGMGVASLLIENIVCHPLLVLRRTCQVSPSESNRFHCVPFHLLPVSIHLYQWQGTSAFYKGLSGCLTLRGLQMGAEDLTSKMTPWPKELDKGGRTSLRRIGQHLMLKATSLAITAPFYSASLIETVQSDIACEKPGVFDIFREGLSRLAPSGGRLLPMWLLLPPTVCHGMAHYVVTSGVSTVAAKVMNSKAKDAASEGRVEQLSNAFGHLAADVLLYPIETVLHRLHLQGSRTIIDSLDSGVEVVPVMTRYEGVLDCFETIKSEEGVWGFYRGFGALLVQYAIRLAALHAVSLVVKEIANLIVEPEGPPPSVQLNPQLINQTPRTPHTPQATPNSQSIPVSPSRTEQQ